MWYRSQLTRLFISTEPLEPKKSAKKQKVRLAWEGFLRCRYLVNIINHIVINPKNFQMIAFIFFSSAPRGGWRGGGGYLSPGLYVKKYRKISYIFSIFGIFWATKKTWATPRLVFFWGLIQNFQQACPSVSYGNPPSFCQCNMKHNDVQPVFSSNRTS